LKVENVRKIIDRVNDGHRVAAGVHTFLWCLVFVSSWLSQCGFSGRQRR
jgi:hypothetical protein